MREPDFNTLEERKQEEIAFHDQLREANLAQRWSPELEPSIQADPLWANMKYYSVERRTLTYVEDWLRQHAADAVVLDYCCGNGDDSIRLAREFGAREVVGIDISPKSIENCRQRAREAGVESRTRFEVMDAEALEFPDDTFDVVNIYGVLHHLELRRAYAEIARVLKPGGRAIATEALRHNPAIHLYRRLTPQLRTAWEVDHILGRREVRLAERYFREVNAQCFDLATLAAVPFRNRPALFDPVLRWLEAVDAAVLRIPGIRWLAWKVVFTMSGPRKAS
jgi:ubiquinone/menaquinone biosynthesis C-methylase UbiE